MNKLEGFKNFLLLWLLRVREFFGNHYSYELEGFSLYSSEIIYKVKGKHQTYKKNISDAYRDNFFLSAFSPIDVKQICRQYHSELSITDNEKKQLQDSNLFIPTKSLAQKHRFLPCLAMLYIAMLIIAILMSPNFVKVGLLTEPGGILLFPLTYLIADIISEVYGYQIVRIIIWSSLVCLLIVTLGITISLALPAISIKQGHEYTSVFGNMPRLLLANGLSIILSDFCNAYLFSKLKILTHGKYLWLRFIGASAIGEITYTMVWIIVFFISQLSLGEMLAIGVQNYFFKVFYSIFFIPFTYIISNMLKKSERVDTYDYNISYNIFSANVDEASKKDQDHKL